MNACYKKGCLSHRRRYSLTLINFFLVCIALALWRQISLNARFMTNDSQPLESFNLTTNQSEEIVIPDTLFQGDPAHVKKRVQDFLVNRLAETSKAHKEQLQKATNKQMKRFLDDFKREHENWINESFKLPQDTRKWMELAKQLKNYNEKLIRLEDAYTQNDRTKDHLYPPALSTVIREMKETRVTGFKFCSILDNAAFNPWIHICK